MMLSFLAAWGLAAVAFALVWAVSMKIRNYGFLDVIWSYAVALIAPIYALLGPGDFTRKLLYCGLGTLWSLRLGSYIFLRVLRHHPKEDIRYETLRQRWPSPGMFLAFFQLQALIAVIFSGPFLLASWNTAGPFTLVEFAGLAVAVISIGGESLADRQMARFKSEPGSHGKVCESGLWRYSRHPNYFFEFLFWVGIFVASVNTPRGWITIICPLLMYHFLTKVTGIPLTEEYALKSKGGEYQRYQQTTSAFVPWFRRNPQT